MQKLLLLLLSRRASAMMMTQAVMVMMMIATAAADLVSIPLQQFPSGTVAVKANYVMPKVSFFAKSAPALVTLARLIAGMHPFMPMNAEYPVKGFVAIPALELSRRNFNYFARCSVYLFRYLDNERVIVVFVWQ